MLYGKSGRLVSANGVPQPVSDLRTPEDVVCTQQTQEIGVRMALGAATQSVFSFVLGQALSLVAIGVLAGLLAAGVLTGVRERLLYQTEPLGATEYAHRAGRSIADEVADGPAKPDTTFAATFSAYSPCRAS